ncbi:MAG: PA0069 family radical SAM protein [Proteobacteria bacterium]|nr:PA0069 family radical SAM protein [Pseudomonadota bacterium]
MSDNQIIPYIKSLRRGRGATINPMGRFEPEQRDRTFDGWTEPEPREKRLRTTVTMEKAKSVISRNISPDLPFERSINAYRGCEHGCIYCFARPTHAFVNLSPGLDFESRLFAKPDAADLLTKELSRPTYSCRPIALGTNTDPYQPIERDLKITRDILTVLAEAKHPFSITTKSSLVLRDLDILTPLAKDNLVSVGMSVTSLDNRLSRAMEPRACSPQKRIAAIRELSEAGVPTIVQVAPVIPALNDPEMEDILEAAKEAGAVSAIYLLLRLPGEVAELFENWLIETFPDRASRVMKLVRSTRGGKNYEAAFGTRMVGRGPYAALINQRFKLACRHLGFTRSKYDLATDLFQKPNPDRRQMSLF